MSKSIISKAMTFLSLALLVSAVHAQANDATSQGHAATKVRIVRLSMVKGVVEINRDKTRGFERAIANLPVVEGNEIRTGIGAAEVEFEDNSSMRIAPSSEVQFSELRRDADGATVSSVNVLKGIAFVSLVKADSKAPLNQFDLLFCGRKVALVPASHVRLEIDDSQARLAVIDGIARVDGAQGELEVAKKKTATFDVRSEDEPTVAKDIEKTPFDGWDHDATSYHANASSLMASRSAYGFGSTYAYGLSDMSYYGNFMDAGGGCGMMWRPYFVSAAWDPFSNGAWAWYPGAGYSWVSPYPWAWTPYHYGSWGFCPGVGWGWSPGGSWYGINNVAALLPKGGSGGIKGGPVPPIHPPQPHEPGLIAVNMKPLVVSEVASPTSFEFRKDSAGLGVPRGTLGHLEKFSHETESHGTTRTSIYMSLPQANHVGGTSSLAASMGSAIHRGSAPSSGPSSNSSFSSLSGGGGGSAGSARSSNVSVAPGPSAPSGGAKK